MGVSRKFAAASWHGTARLIAACLLVLVPLQAAPAADRADVLGALESITAAELQRHVDVLADDTFEGREGGTRGGHAAANYLADHLQRYGLKPAGEAGSYFQGFGGNYRNLLGLLEGRDPELRHEIIVVGAHYDHVGYGSPTNSYGPFGYIHNGADDNASGVAGLLEVMDAFQRLAEPPRRSILFAFWDGEEQGLLGSKHWTTAPTLPLDQVVLAINVDMIGRLRSGKLEVYGARTAPGLRQLASRANQDPNLWLDFNWEMKANSDHYSFFARRIPVLMLHTGLHEDYHRPSDDAHKINAAGIQQVASLLFNLTRELAEQDYVPAFRARSQHESPHTQRELERPLPLPPPRLGIAWNAEPAGGLIVTRVTPGTPAARSGLARGDRLVALDDVPIEDEHAFRYRILSAAEPVRIAYERGGQPAQTAVITLDGSPSRIGITWREDDGEPGAFLLIQVVPGSPAQLAGLKPGDRIYEADGQTFRSTDELARWLHAARGPLELVIERRGQLHRLTVPLEPVELGG